MNGARTSGNIPPSLLPSPAPRYQCNLLPTAESPSAPPTSPPIGGWVSGGVASVARIATRGRCVFKRRHTCVLLHNCIKMSQILLTFRSFVSFRAAAMKMETLMLIWTLILARLHKNETGRPLKNGLPLKLSCYLHFVLLVSTKKKNNLKACQYCSFGISWRNNEIVFVTTLILIRHISKKIKCGF